MTLRGISDVPAEIVPREVCSGTLVDLAFARTLGPGPEAVAAAADGLAGRGCPMHDLVIILARK
jgi:hypothetical protein